MGSPCFADVLADTLRGGAGTGAAAAWAAATSAPSSFRAAPPHPFRFGAAPALAQAHAVFAFDATARTFPPRPRPVRALTTAQELRRACRSIAQRVHPDRQHDCGDAERARSSRLFVAATTHDRRLRALVDGR